MRLIDADQFEGFSTNCKGYDAKSYIAGAKAVLEVIDSAPTVDAVPVRCGECQGWEPGKRKIHKCDLCRMFGFGPGDYCSLGHRKDGEK